MEASSQGGTCGLRPPFTMERVAGFIAIAFISIIIFSQYLPDGSANHSVELKTYRSADIQQPTTPSTMATVVYPDCFHMSLINSTVTSSREKIWKAWDVGHYPNFQTYMHVPELSWSIQKAKFVKLILEPKSADTKFVVGFSGSSVTAGHDNYFREAYPNVFYEAMLPALSTILSGTLNSTQFEVRNHALGNNPCYAYDACVETHMGSDLDILAWEQSMNCGHDSKYLDTFSRAAHRMPKQPTVMFLQSGTPTWKAADCPAPASAAAAVSAASLTEAEKRVLASPLRSTVDAAHHMHNMDFLKDGTHYLFDRFASLAPMGQNVLPADGYKCRGPYLPSFSEKTPGGGAGWHPGRLGHKLRGDSLAYTLLSILGEAVADVTAVVCPAKGAPSVNGASPTKAQPGGGQEPPKAINQASLPFNSSKPVEKAGCNMTSPTTSERSAASIAASAAYKAAVATPPATAPAAASAAAKPIPALPPPARASNSSKPLGTPATVMAGLGRNGTIVAKIPAAPAIATATASAAAAPVAAVKPADTPAAAAAAPAHAHHAGGQGHAHHRRALSGTVSNLQHASDTLKYSHHGPILKQKLTEDGSKFVPGAQSGNQLAHSLAQVTTYYLQDIFAREVGEVPKAYGIDETNAAPTCYTNFEPRKSHCLSMQIVRSQSNWNYSLSFFDAAAVAKSEAAGMGYVDRKNIYTSVGKGSRIAVRVKSSRTNPLWLCELQKGFLKYPTTMDDLNKGARVYVLNDYKSQPEPEGTAMATVLPKFDASKYTQLHLAEFSDQCYRTTTTIPMGEHLVIIEQAGSAQVNLAYVVAW